MTYCWIGLDENVPAHPVYPTKGYDNWGIPKRIEAELIDTQYANASGFSSFSREPSSYTGQAGQAHGVMKFCIIWTWRVAKEENEKQNGK